MFEDIGVYPDLNITILMYQLKRFMYPDLQIITKSIKKKSLSKGLQG
jgi:hypothetical protein